MLVQNITDRLLSSVSLVLAYHNEATEVSMYNGFTLNLLVVVID